MSEIDELCNQVKRLYDDIYECRTSMNEHIAAAEKNMMIIARERYVGKVLKISTVTNMMFRIDAITNIRHCHHDGITNTIYVYQMGIRGCMISEDDDGCVTCRENMHWTSDIDYDGSLKFDETVSMETFDRFVRMSKIQMDKDCRRIRLSDRVIFVNDGILTEGTVTSFDKERFAVMVTLDNGETISEDSNKMKLKNV